MCSALLLKYAMDQGSSAGLYYMEKTVGYSLKKQTMLDIMVMFSYTAGFVAFLLLSLFHSQPTHPLYLFTVALRESTY